ncbi:MAG: PEP/pyruvate-binding domain-containing protein, partial [Ilumatobacteraceae bacterium]
MQTVQPDRSVLDFEEIDPTRVALVGGKGANLAALAGLEGVSMPAGFCVTTDAYRRVVAEAVPVGDQLARLSLVVADDRESIATISAEIRGLIEAIPIPDDVAAEITAAVARLGDETAFAVRSSATAEDLPTASFAGQQDSFLNVRGSAAVLQHVGRCWASLFTERAVTYRLRNGIDQRTVLMAVVVQEMVVPLASGVMFTADPVTSSRKVVTIEATFGLGEAVVSGLVDPDAYRIRAGELVAKEIGSKRLAVVASPTGGTEVAALEPEQQERSSLTDEQAARLAQLGRRIEAHFGCPQDIEWCLSGDGFQIVQSRPITTLFPIPDAGDDANHVYISVGHQQMMTDAMKPLGLSIWQLTALRPMHVAGGRLFVDVTRRLASPADRVALLELMGRSDPLTRDALQTVLDRRDLITPLPDDTPVGPPPVG